MRRDLLGRLPALMQFYPGLKPWDLERMTLRETTRLVRYMDDALFQIAQHNGIQGTPTSD